MEQWQKTHGQHQCGFTLIELVVVISLILMMMGLAMPQIRNAVLTDTLKRSALRLAGLAKNLRDEAIREQKHYGLHLDMVHQTYWIGFENMDDEALERARENAENLPESVRISDVWIRGEGKVSDGEAVILFFKKGYVQPAAIHLADDDDRQLTISLSPFGGRVKVLDKYVDFESES